MSLSAQLFKAFPNTAIANNIKETVRRDAMNDLEPDVQMGEPTTIFAAIESAIAQGSTKATHSLEAWTDRFSEFELGDPSRPITAANLNLFLAE